MLFGGALANASFVASLGQEGRQLNFVAVGLAGTLGNLVGSWIAWGVGWRGGRPLIERWGRYVFLRQHEIDRAEVWFDRPAGRGVRVTDSPGRAELHRRPAGIAEMPFVRSRAPFLDACPGPYPGGLG